MPEAKSPDVGEVMLAQALASHTEAVVTRPFIPILRCPI